MWWTMRFQGLLLLLCLTGAVMISEGKTYIKKLIEMDRLGEDDQVIVQISGTKQMVAQYFCENGSCRSELVGFQFKTESGYLVLIMHNINHTDRFDAFLNFKEPILLNFTLDEEPLHTTKMPEPTGEPTGEALSTEAIVAIKTSVPVALLLIAVIAVIAYKRARRSEQDGIIASTITSQGGEIEDLRLDTTSTQP